MSQTLIVIEGDNDVQTLKSELSNKEVKIITFDFLSHKSLKNMGISHALVEDYFSAEDQEIMDGKAVELTTTWYKDNEISKFLQYDSFNIGKLLETEFIYYFFQHIKRVFGILRVIEKEHPSKIICSFLGGSVETMCKDPSVKIIKYQTKESLSLYYDRIEIPINIRGRIFAVKISRKNFFALKKILEKIIDIFFNVKAKPSELKNKKSILLLEFNPISYHDLLISLSNAEQSMILLNQRRPATWNFKSLNILKKSNCKVIQLEDFSDSNILKKISTTQNELKISMNFLFLKNNLFERIFSINGQPFWESIKESFTQIIIDRFTEAVKRFILVETLFENVDVSCILEWAHVPLEEQTTILAANKRKIPSIFLQHGLNLLNSKFEKYITIFPILPSNDSKEAVWGNIMQKFILGHGISHDKITITGSPRHDPFFTHKKSKDNKNNVLIASNLLSAINYSGNDTHAYELFDTYLRKICEIIKKDPSKKIIVKLHPARPYYDITPIIHEIDPTIPIYRDEDIRILIEDCDVVISMNYSTIILDAMILKKPTMVILPEDQNYEKEIPIIRKATLPISKTEELESSLNDLLYNETVRRDLISKGNEFVNDYMSNQGTSSEHLANILKKY
ncbi:MAG: hypothetical protein HY223_01670 [Thaumarchaeota archaeon]|nr:hypothetical protein [Nitrososphaerota archaeon]